MCLALPTGYTRYGPGTGLEQRSPCCCVTFGECLGLIFPEASLGGRSVSVCARAYVCVCVRGMWGVRVLVMRGQGIDNHRGSPSFGFPIRGGSQLDAELPPQN